MPTSFYVPFLLAGMIITVRLECVSSLEDCSSLPQGSSNSLWSKWQVRFQTLLPPYGLVAE